MSGVRSIGEQHFTKYRVAACIDRVRHLWTARRPISHTSPSPLQPKPSHDKSRPKPPRVPANSARAQIRAAAPSDRDRPGTAGSLFQAARRTHPRPRMRPAFQGARGRRIPPLRNPARRRARLPLDVLLVRSINCLPGSSETLLISRARNGTIFCSMRPGKSNAIPASASAAIPTAPRKRSRQRRSAAGVKKASPISGL